MTAVRQERSSQFGPHATTLISLCLPLSCTHMLTGAHTHGSGRMWTVWDLKPHRKEGGDQWIDWRNWTNPCQEFSCRGSRQTNRRSFPPFCRCRKRPNSSPNKGGSSSVHRSICQNFGDKRAAVHPTFATPSLSAGLTQTKVTLT